MENNLVDRAALAAVVRKQKEYTLEGKYFNFVHELLQETDVQREAGNPVTMVPQINTLALYNTTTSNETPPQYPKNDTQCVQIGKTGQHNITARPRAPSQEKLE